MLPDLPARPTWQDNATCAHHAADWHSEAVGVVAYAKQVCATCPVLTECRDWCDAIERDRSRSMNFGVYGGETPDDRHARRLAEGSTYERCRGGHRRTPENTQLRTDGKRQCRECVRAAAARRRKEAS